MRRILFALLGLTIAFSTASAQTVPEPGVAAQVPVAAGSSMMTVTATRVTVTGPVTIVPPSPPPTTMNEAYTPQGCGHPIIRCEAVNGILITAPGGQISFYTNPAEANTAAAAIVGALTPVERERALALELAAARAALAEAQKLHAAVVAHLDAVRRATEQPPRGAATVTTRR